MKALLQLAGALALLSIAALCLPAYRILSAHAAQAPAIDWNLRAASWNAAVTTANSARASAGLAAVTDQLADPKTGAAAQVRGLRRDAVAQVRGLREDVRETRETARQVIAAAIDMVDRRTGEALSTANGQLNGIRDDIRPTLQNTAALTTNLNDSWDDLYPDVRASVESATVAATSMAHASESIRVSAEGFSNFLPVLQTNVGKITEQSAGIASNINRVTKPHWYDRFITGAAVGVRIIK